MRPSNKSRSRNKPGNNNPNRRNNVGNIVNRVFESAGPDGKVRGTPQQIIDKYQALARDAQVSGDRVAAESYLQHAEHYARLLSESLRQFQESRPQHERSDERSDDREEREEEAPRERVEAVAQPQPQPQMHRHEAPRRQEEPSGLTTLGAEDAYAGPVETPEGGARRRPDLDEPVEAAPVINGEHRPDDLAAEPAPAKRPRTRRKAKAMIQAFEASPE